MKVTIADDASVDGPSRILGSLICSAALLGCAAAAPPVVHSAPAGTGSRLVCRDVDLSHSCGGKDGTRRVKRAWATPQNFSERDDAGENTVTLERLDDDGSFRLCYRRPPFDRVEIRYDIQCTDGTMQLGWSWADTSY